MHVRFSQSFEVVRELPEALKPLKSLAFNLWWSWSTEAQDLFRDADPQVWAEQGHNPLALIENLSEERRDALANDTVYLRKLSQVEAMLQHYLERTPWFDQAFPGEREKTKVAYFCFEFGLSECLPIYSGGLGVLAGDHLKAASDLGIPMVAIGLLYSRGYFKQYLNPDGWQQEFYPTYDFYGMPLFLVRGDDGRPVLIEVELPDRTVTCQIWKAQVGRIPLYLLDSNVLSNNPDDQSITDALYSGDEHMRIRQEMILGIGGMRALEALGIKPTVCHMNEGHAAFLALERIRQIMLEHHCDFRTARQIVVSGNVFTTHTPVPAGIDIFRPEILQQYMLRTVKSVGLDFESFLRLGRFDPENGSEPFNMAVFAMESANHVNGVSKLHAEVSRKMFQSRWPSYPIDEIPIAGITNGIHTSTWLSPDMANLMDRHLGDEWRDDPASLDVWNRVSQIPDDDLWDYREAQRASFVRFVRDKMTRSVHGKHAARKAHAHLTSILDPRVLTIGFARRFATYKRATLLLSDKDRLLRMIFDEKRPVQFVFAGKAHPRDDGGKKLIQEIFQFIRDHNASSRIVLLEDYDMDTARQLVQGVDLWLNNPRRPNEASGTSGMKVVPNGGLNCSILDGWWAEAYEEGVGWAIGDEVELQDSWHQDWLDSNSLYQVLEQQVIPAFYSRNDNGIPTEWLRVMKNSLRKLAPRFSTARMLREYTSRFYLPASTSFQNLQSDGLRRAKAALAWRDKVRGAWPNVKVVKVEDNVNIRNVVGQEVQVDAWVQLGRLTPDEVRVQILEGHVTAMRELADLNLFDLDLVGKEDNVARFRVSFPCEHSGLRGYIVRVIPNHADVNVASEIPLIVWQDSRY